MVHPGTLILTFLSVAIVAPALAQGSTEPISGGAGWAGAGLLSCVLGWLLLKHLPAKDAQVQQLIAGHQEQMAAKDVIHSAALDKHAAVIEKQSAAHAIAMAAMTAAYIADVKDGRVEYKGSLDRLMQSHERQMDGVSKIASQSVEELATQVESLGEAVRELSPKSKSKPT